MDTNDMSEFRQNNKNDQNADEPKVKEFKCPNKQEHILKPLYSSPYDMGCGVMCDICYEFIEDGSGELFYHCENCRPEADFCKNCINSDYSKNNLSMIESVKISIKRNLEGFPFGPSGTSSETRN
jgi:hypothetical protein